MRSKILNLLPQEGYSQENKQTLKASGWYEGGPTICHWCPEEEPQYPIKIPLEALSEC